MSPDFRVALIGYGHAGAVFHGPLIRATPGFSLTEIVTSNPSRIARARQDHPAARVLGSAADLWQVAADVDLVVIASPNRTHVPLAMAALQQDLPVVIDKPIAASAADARAVIAEAARRNRLLTVFQNRRWDGDFLTLERLIAAGRLGTIVRFESRFERWRPALRGGWREGGDPDDAGGLLYDLGAHLIDQALLLFGPVTGVYAELDRRRTGAQVDDDSFVALTHASGVRSHLWMSVLAAEPGPRFRLIGTRGTYVKFGLDPQEDALRGGADPAGPSFGTEPQARWGSISDGQQIGRLQTETGDYRRFYRDVAAALRDGTAPPVDPEDAARTLELIEAARRSSKEDDRVPQGRPGKTRARLGDNTEDAADPLAT
jgi:predicted dehydrogenase